MELARESLEGIAGHQIALYRWGTGPRVILLVHGWEGRASDFAPLVRELRSRERTIVALEAPGHGTSSGTRTNVIEFGAILSDLASRFGRFETVISHSLGTPAVAAAARRGLEADGFISISGLADLTRPVSTFCNALGLSAAMDDRVRVCLEDHVFGGDREIWERCSAARSPLPADSPLLIIHDRADRLVPYGDAELLAHAHPGSNRILTTEGLGHSRILAADAVLDAVLEFLDAPALVQEPVGASS
jgi:pimeloyl-ACP methyl ester carboxylesterase